MLVRSVFAILILMMGMVGATRAALKRDAPPRIVATIPPLASLAASVVGEGEITILVPGNLSPHNYALRPSDARALRDADIILWVGPNFETFLKKPIATYAEDAHLITASTLEGIRVSSRRTGGLWAARGDDDEDEHHADDDDAHENSDPHIWLDPHNARIIVRAVALALIARNPSEKRSYRRNGRNAQEALRKLESDMRKMLDPVRGRPFIVMHDAYGNLDKAFGLNSVGSVQTDEARLPGARHVRRLRYALARGEAVCLFAEPQASERLAERLVDGTPGRLSVLDPLGSTLTPDKTLYPRLMRTLAGNIASCLAP